MSLAKSDLIQAAASSSKNTDLETAAGGYGGHGYGKKGAIGIGKAGFKKAGAGGYKHGSKGLIAGGIHKGKKAGIIAGHAYGAAGHKVS